MTTFAPRLLLSLALLAPACAGAITAPQATPSGPAGDALIVLPGFGYSGMGERTLRQLAPAMRADGIDLYVPEYLARGGLDKSRERLRRFIHEQRLERYQRIHVFTFIAGGWTFNPLAADADVLPNLATVIYDRSPYQERAPRIAAQKLGPLAWVRHGKLLFEVARTPYSPLARRHVKVGLVVETQPTPFIKRFAETARSYGPYSFACEALAQPFDDCMFVPLNHSQMYGRFADTWPEVRAFIKHGRFTDGANRTPPDGGSR
jgi:hypothetical protein